MSDEFVTVVDVDATIDEAPALAERLTRWLINQGVLSPDMTDCVLSEDNGYPPGPNVALAVMYPEQVYPPSLLTCGMEIRIGREVHFSSDLEVSCPACGFGLVTCEMPSSELMESEWDSSLADWQSGGEGLLTCPECGAQRSLTEWKYDPPWGFGNLAFTFWNWTILKPEFIAQIGEFLGHRVVVPYGRL